MGNLQALRHQLLARLDAGVVGVAHHHARGLEARGGDAADALAGHQRTDAVTRLLHLGLACFGLLAWGTGWLADDYKELSHIGFSMHGWLGIGTAVFTGLRLLYGFAGPRPVRFWNWLPVTPARLDLVWEDLRGLSQLQLPDREPRQGLAAVVESFGLAVFTFLSGTGIALFLYLEPGTKARGTMHFVKELHEAGEVLIPLFISVHVGAVLMHALTGRHLWRKMLFLRDP
ncbi:MAG: cytochrome b/b6 domain-containing protein [Nitrospirae bacterium]|nr:cytochrome b/b6 domain-containing protein [Nitrospirota bacterium]